MKSILQNDYHFIICLVVMTMLPLIMLMFFCYFIEIDKIKQDTTVQIQNQHD